jgi:protein-S-isoprenylcysteine O-methyltransferase Ste14
MRALVMFYGVACYTFFFAVFVYLIAFIGDIFVPKTISSGETVDFATALIINLSLILLWGVQHTVMARAGFKEAIKHIIPHHTERSTYVLLSSVVLVILMYFWQPMSQQIWQVTDATGVAVLWGIFGAGWLLVLLSTFLTDHFDLFGLRHTWLHFVQRDYTSVPFTERFFYKSIRHPMMLGLLIAFWATPSMDMGHLVFSVGMSIYIVVGIYFEERGLTSTLGDDYHEYRKRTARVIPKIF